MAAKQLVFSEEARRRLKNGVDVAFQLDAGKEADAGWRA